MGAGKQERYMSESEGYKRMCEWLKDTDESRKYK